MKKVLIAILALLPLLMQGQCSFPDTLTLGPPWPNWRDTTSAQSLPCYTPSCGHYATSTGAVVPAFDGCIVVTGDEGWIDAVIYDTCNIVLFDTCFYVIPAAAVVGMICKSYPKPTYMVLYRDTAAYVSAIISNQFGSGWAPLTAIVNTDTICPPIPISFFSYFTGDTIPCYKALCPHPKTYQEAFLAPWDGCIGFDQAVPGWGSLVLVIKDKIVLDTCILTPGTGIPTQVCWSSSDTVKVFYYGPDSTSVGVWHFPGSGYPPLLNEVADTDTLCPLPLSIDPPATEDPQMIDIVTGQQVQTMQPNRVYLVGRKLQTRIE